MARASILAALSLSAALSCKFDSAYRDLPDPGAVPCTEGKIECRGAALTRCDGGLPVTLDDCGARSMVCAPGLLACTPCLPNTSTCDGLDVMRCSADGQITTKVETCNADAGYACRRGSCTQLCDEAAREHSNVGCEYWAVDLDNAVTSQGNAAAQQYAVVVSNVEPDLVASVVVEEDTAAPGAPASIRTVATARVGPRSLEVFKLGPKEVDGSSPGTFDTGTHTALSRGAFRVRSDVPIVAYQFNPLENANVFSNDASLLLPTAALGGNGRSYVIASWPQTIATSENPAQNFGTDLRAFLAIVGTRPDTRVHVKTTARILGGGPIPAGVDKGGAFDVVLQPFEVLNLETGDFNADFTGTLVDSTGPVAVFAGSEASDAPFFPTLASRSCCADHLEEQVVPLRAVGKRYVLGRVPNRSKAIAAAGAIITPFDEPEFYRIVATRPGLTKVTTTLPPPQDVLELDGEGSNRTLVAHQDFVLTASDPVLVADVQASQEAAGVVRGLPGGDPSLTFVAPVEQWRNDYVLLTPDKYAFDFLIITAPFGAQVFVDGLLIDGTICELAPGDGLTEAVRKSPNPPFVTYRCQLSFPGIDPDKPSPLNVLPGRQNDGVHRVQSDYPVGVLVYGFDAFVSYAYAGGTQLRDINPN
ncbi:MAG: IgGFc-binding protein [Labilithrix sp.]|nr:IgGFc-binding protein [Labilithrix sp.]